MKLDFHNRRKENQMDSKDNSERLQPCKCAICGGTDTGTACLSTVILKPGYGSRHDMEKAEVNVCGDCMDWLIDCLRACEVSNGR